MKEPNKLMIYLLQKVFKFECKACTRYWSYDEFQTHKLKGNCKKDPNATNYVSKLALITSDCLTYSISNQHINFDLFVHL